MENKEEDLIEGITSFADERDAMVNTVMLIIGDSIDEKYLETVKKSLGRCWINGFRYGYGYANKEEEQTFLDIIKSRI